jgi:enhancing lycopene biosynthesis protein 2
MVQTGKRNIQSETARKMLTWSYYKFKQIIQAKDQPYDCLIVPVNNVCNYYGQGPECSSQEHIAQVHD